MTVNAIPDKLAPPPGAALPRMVGESDVALIRQHASALVPEATLLEFGPWMGGVTEILAEYGNVEVVDRFEWSERNAEAFPEVDLALGASFRPLFVQNMQARSLEITVHESPYQGFVWPGDGFDLCFIDAPRNVSGLLHCLRAIAHAWRPDAPVLLKHGLSVSYPELPAALEVLVGRDIVRLPRSAQPRWCNIAVLYPGRALADLEMLKSANLLEATPLSPWVKDPWGGRLLSAARLAERLTVQNWSGAFQVLETVPSDPTVLYAWDGFEAAWPQEVKEDPAMLAVFAEVLAAQVDPFNPPASCDGSLPVALRAWWHNNRGPRRWRAFDPDTIATAFERGAMLWPTRLKEQVHGKKVIEVGVGLTHSAVGFSTVGAANYLGIVTGDLKSDMMRLEHHLPGVSFLSLSGVRTKHAENADICLIHEEVAGRADVAACVQEIQPVLAKKAQILVISPHRDAPRRYAK